MAERYTLLAIDPSLAAPGFAVLDLGRAEPHLIAAGVWETAPDKKAPRKSDDNMRRALYVWRELRAVIAKHRPHFIAIESGSGSKNAKTALMLGMAQMVAACAADLHLSGSPIYVTAMAAGAALGLDRTQRRAKGAPKKTTGEAARDRKARKAAIAKAVIARLGAAEWGRALGLVDLSSVTITAIEHHGWEGAHDAAAIALAAWELPEVAGIRMIARQTIIDDVLARGAKGAAELQRNMRSARGGGILYGSPPIDEDIA